MKTTNAFSRCRQSVRRSVFQTSVIAALALGTANHANARKPIRDAFFAYYPSAPGSALDNLPSKAGHCGVCHYDFNGGGQRNPYGISLEAVAQANGLDVGMKNDRPLIIALADGMDPDGDGFTTHGEMNATGGNAPTFPGWSAAYLSKVISIPQAEVQPYLKPLSVLPANDTTPPSVTVFSPNGGLPDVIANTPTSVIWSASDASGISEIRIYLSLDNGATFKAVEVGLANTGSYSWIPANRPATAARIRVMAVDGAGNTANDASNAAFAIISPAGGAVPSTLRDFDMPGSQPFESGVELVDSNFCANCHGNYNPAVEPYANWQGSMMSHASIDPLFKANLAIANQDAPESGDLCLRCHNPRGWLQGRSVPTDGSRMHAADQGGVSCDLCHRMVDPVYQAGVSPPEDLLVHQILSFPGNQYGNGMMVIDPASYQRGPFPAAGVQAPHHVIESSFNTKSAFCGTCHDVSNPAFTKNGDGIYQPNDFNAPATDFSPHSIAPVERTYSEWLNSTYATTGVVQPEFAGNKAGGLVSSCQDCHMRDVTGVGCNLANVQSRNDLPLHDMTGGSTWVPSLLPALHPEQVNPAAIQAGIARATYMLQNAATLQVGASSGNLQVTVTNQTGHKLPTGYPEGRRIWLNVKFFDAGNNLISESGAYDSSTGVLSHDPQVKIYEVHPGIGENIAGVGGLPAGPSLHFVLNNKVFEDNRIPPRGFNNAAFAAFGGAPVGHSYADGQHWDETAYSIPGGTARAEVRLYYQSTSKEFIEFLRDNNNTNSAGQDMFNLWNANGKCPPVLMEQTTWTAPTIVFTGLQSATPRIESATLNWSAATSSHPPVTYRIYHSTVAGGEDFGTPLLTTTNLSTVVSPLDPGSTGPLNHYFVVRASDNGGATEGNTLELAVQPLLDPAKDQDDDGMPNGIEQDYTMNPFNPADAMQDADDDGLNNLIESTLGSIPTDAASAHWPHGAWVDLAEPPERHFALSYVRRKELPTADIIVEVSDDLSTWHSGPEFTETESVTTRDPETDTVVERMKAPMNGAAFMRLRIQPK